MKGTVQSYAILAKRQALPGGYGTEVVGFADCLRRAHQQVAEWADKGLDVSFMEWDFSRVREMDRIGTPWYRRVAYNGETLYIKD